MIPAALIQGEQKRKQAKQPKAETYRVQVEIDGEDYEFELESTVGAPSDEYVNRLATQYAGQIRKGNKAFKGATPAGATGNAPPKKKPKTTGIGPQFPAVRGAEIGAMGAGASRAVSVEEINARELSSAPTEDLIREVLRGPNQKTSAKQERYRAVIDELQNRATTAGKNTPLGALMGPTGFLPAPDKLKAILNAGHLSGLVSGALLEPFETGASFGKASSGADLDFRDNLNLIGAVPQTGAAIGAIAKKGAEKLAAKVAGKDLITPPVKTGTKPATAAMPATPTQTGIVVRDAPVRGASVLDEALASPTVKPAETPSPAKAAETVTPPTAAKPKEPWEMTREEFTGRPAKDINFEASQREGGNRRIGVVSDFLRSPSAADLLRVAGDVPVELVFRESLPSGMLQRGERAFYDPTRRVITVVGGADAADLERVLFHEAAHAARDIKGRPLSLGADYAQRAHEQSAKRAEGLADIKPKSLGDWVDHMDAVDQALREGKPVPAEVLADYPDLAAKYGNATPPTSVLDEALASPKTSALPENADTKALQVAAPENVGASQVQTPNAWVKAKEYKGSDGGKYADYALFGDLRRGTVTVEIDRKNGYRIRNVFVDSKDMRSGHATNAYRLLNDESIASTGKPLRSSTIGRSDRTTLNDDGVALWESLVAKGEAVKNGDYYAFKTDASVPTTQPSNVSPKQVPSDVTVAPEPNQVQTATVSPDAPPVKESLTTDPPSAPTSARQADINADREALGKAGFSTDDVRKWSDLEKNADPALAPKDAEKPWSDQDTVNAVAKLRDLKAKIETERAAVKARGEKTSELLVSLEDEFDDLTENMYRAGTEQGRALASRRYTMDMDMSADAMRARYKARAAKNGTKVDAKRLKELEDIAGEYARLQEQIANGEIVRARSRRKGPAKTKEELAAELSQMWDDLTKKNAQTVDEFMAEGVESAGGFDPRVLGKLAVKAIELGVATVDELVEEIAKQFKLRGLDAPTREEILKAWQAERESSTRVISDEVKAARAQRAKLEAEIRAELNAPAKAEANAKREAARAEAAAKAAEERARKAAERLQTLEANRKAKADAKARARAEKAAADAEAKALREEQERILSERSGWDKRNKERQQTLDRLNTRIAELEQSIDAGTGEGPKTRATKKEDVDIERLRAKMTMLQSRARAIYASTQPKGVADKAVGLLNVPRTIKASIDISAPGRQGWILGIGNPKAAGRAFADQMRALSTEEGAVMAQNAIMDRPNAPRYKAADLYLAPVDGSLNAKEEAFLGSEMFSRWKKFNPVRASDRAYAAYLNRLRADVFDNMANALGPNATDEQLREIARYINIASGRGDIGGKGASQIGQSIGRAMPAAALGLWSPRNLISRIQFVTGVPIGQAIKVPGARRLIAKEYAKTIIATGSVIGLAKLGLEASGQGGVSGDISNSDFGKIRVGDTRVDIMAGVQQPLVLIGRLMTGKTTSPVSGKSSDLHNPKYGQPGPGDLTWRFIKSKANPIFGSAEELYTGKDFVGQPVSKGEALTNVIAPLSVKEIYEALTEEGVDREDALVLLNIFGISTARFNGKEKAQP